MAWVTMFASLAHLSQGNQLDGSVELLPGQRRAVASYILPDLEQRRVLGQS